MFDRIQKAVAAAISSGVVALIFAAISDGGVTPEEVAAIFAAAAGAGGVTWRVPNRPRPFLRQPRP